MQTEEKKAPGYSDEELAELRAKHPDKELHQLIAPTGEAIVVRLPSRGEWTRFRTKAADDRKRFEASEHLMASCVLKPSGEAFDAMLDKRPALGETFLDSLLSLAGLAKDVEKKAL